MGGGMCVEPKMGGDFVRPMPDTHTARNAGWGDVTKGHLLRL